MSYYAPAPGEENIRRVDTHAFDPTQGFGLDIDVYVARGDGAARTIVDKLLAHYSDQFGSVVGPTFSMDLLSALLEPSFGPLAQTLDDAGAQLGVITGFHDAWAWLHERPAPVITDNPPMLDIALAYPTLRAAAAFYVDELNVESVHLIALVGVWRRGRRARDSGTVHGTLVVNALLLSLSPYRGRQSGFRF
ncbi:hypothetical protein C8R45DRAFT_1020328 [Mycena sanguinolenta]|nr:hypothetical protein C8R45DRAFT_1020328 [Mycena sanguinolenta]